MCKDRQQGFQKIYFFKERAPCKPDAAAHRENTEACKMALKDRPRISLLTKFPLQRVKLNMSVDKATSSGRCDEARLTCNLATARP
jgi:hypothetical protein